MADNLFDKVVIRAVDPDGWPIDFELTPEPGKTAEAIAFLTSHGYTPAGSTPTALDTKHGQVVGSFAAEQLTATVDDGKAYWKVKGANFQKFGVTVWPEVLEDAGFNVAELNPLKPVDLTGWTAVYSIKENGQPKKVIKLE